jgi:two-component system sensor histidine kinase HupT/HoxJ
VASPQAGNAGDPFTALQEISDSLAAIVQTTGQPSGNNSPDLGPLLRANKVSMLALLAAGLAHEVRNPLLVIRSYVDLIGDELRAVEDQGLATGLPDDGTSSWAEVVDRLRLYHDESMRAVKQAMAVVRDYRSVATDRMDVERIDLAELCQEAVRLVRPAFGLGPSLQVVTTPAPPAAAKRSHLLQVLLNLIINACQAAGPTGRVLLTVDSHPHDGGVTVTVGNDGAPIPSDLLHYLFEPLVTSKVETGSGLGLPISQALVERMGGQIEVESRPDWTIFRVSLPPPEQGEARRGSSG